MSGDFEHSIEVAAAYARDVLNGRIITCKLVQLAISRHLDDLENGHNRGLYFDEQAAQDILDWFLFLRHSKGEWAGQQFYLEPWQQFHLSVIFGWKRIVDDKRRFRTVYIEMPRKNGKSTETAGIGLFLLVADQEPGAEIYTAATKRDQAKIIHAESTNMVKSSPALSARVHVVRDNLSVLSTSSKYEPLGADADTCDGLNIHAAIIDELHAHKTRALWDVIETGTGSRSQPLIFTITTSGFNKLGICYEQREYVCKILQSIIQDDTYFGIIYTIDEGDDWRMEYTWKKANPNYGISVKPDDIERLCKKAIEMPGAQNNFLCKRLNIWTNAETLWMNMEKWAECNGPVHLEGLRLVPCVGAIDLASTSDICALRFVWEVNGSHFTWGRYYLPEDAVRPRSEKSRVPYDRWADQGLLTLTPGNVTDYNFIERDVMDCMARFQIKGIGFDRWNSSQLVINLTDEGVPMIAFGQGYTSMSAPMKELERLVLSKQLSHAGDEILTWMASNTVCKEDEAGNIKPDRKRSFEKIDGIVTLIMCIGILNVAPKEPEYKIMIL